MYLTLKYAIGIIYTLSFVVAIVSIGIVLSQRSKKTMGKLGARIGLLAYHGMYGGMITCNIFNLFLTKSTGHYAIYIIVILANGYLYWNFDKMRTVRRYREILDS